MSGKSPAGRRAKLAVMSAASALGSVAPQLGLDGGVRHLGREDVGRPRSVLSVEAASKQDSQEVLQQPHSHFGPWRVDHGRCGHSRMRDEFRAHPLQEVVQLGTPPRQIGCFQLDRPDDAIEHRLQQAVTTVDIDVQ